MAPRWRSFVEQKVLRLCRAARRLPPGWRAAGHRSGVLGQPAPGRVGHGVRSAEPLYGHSQVRNLHLGSELMRAINRWTAAEWLDADPRWRGSIVVTLRIPEAAAEEDPDGARDGRFVQVLLLVRSPEPYGRQRFRPIFRAAAEVGLPVGIHFGGGGTPITGGAGPPTTSRITPG